MSNQNPLTQTTAHKTINATIEFLKCLSGTLTKATKSSQNTNEARAQKESDEALNLTIDEVSGLCLGLDCVSNALEYAYEQCLKNEPQGGDR